MNATAPLRYHLRIYRREHLALPAGLWALFAIMVAFMVSDGGRAYEMANAFLGFVLPLMAGILAASAIVDDTALELQLAAPRAPWRTLVERLEALAGVPVDLISVGPEREQLIVRRSAWSARREA